MCFCFKMFNPEMETMLLALIEERRSDGQAVTRGLIRQKALEYAKQDGAFK